MLGSVSNMAKLKVVVSDPEDGKSRVVEVEGGQAVPLIGRRVGEIIDGSIVGLTGHKLQITGGSDRDGFPMRPNVHGGVRIKIITSEGVGFHPQRHGERRRKTLRGNVITEEIVQVNMKVIEKPKKAKKGKTKEGKEKKELSIPTESKPKEASDVGKTGGESSEAAKAAGG